MCKVYQFTKCTFITSVHRSLWLAGGGSIASHACACIQDTKAVTLYLGGRLTLPDNLFTAAGTENVSCLVSVITAEPTIQK